MSGSPLTELLSLIGSAQLERSSFESSGKSVDDFIQALWDVPGLDGGNLKFGVVLLLLRALETRLLADNELLAIARYPGRFLGGEDELITSRLQYLLGIAPPKSAVAYFRKCLTGHSAQHGQKASISLPIVERVFERAVAANRKKELRCEVCGYHFRKIDMGKDRQDLVDDLGITLSRALHPKRRDDELKPTHKPKLTELQIDHLVPEEGFGWTDPDNLQVTCGFCNGGRLIFRRSYEPVSTMIAGSLSILPEGKEHRFLRQVIIVSQLLEKAGMCEMCGQEVSSEELTVRLKLKSSSSEKWFVPWNLEVVCYSCFGSV